MAEVRDDDEARATRVEDSLGPLHEKRVHPDDGDPQVVKRMAESGITIVSSKSPAEFAAFVKSETERYGKVIKDAHIETE